MMKAKVNLEDVLEAIEIRTRESNYFYNKNTGEIHYITDDELREAEDDIDIGEYPEWQQESIKTAIEILSTDDYIKLPDDYEIDDYEIMEDFCYSLEDKKLRNEMINAIDGKGAFRRFKDKIYENELADEWYKYQDKCFKEIAIDWCERHDIEYEGGNYE
ncbi:MAG: UPF0158 family protein [Bacillota bacterium]